MRRIVSSSRAVGTSHFARGAVGGLRSPLMRSFSSDAPIPVTVARGDGIGPEIMDSTLRVLEAAEVKLAPEFVTMGEDLYTNGVLSGIDQEGWDSMARTNLLLKAPITTPLGKGVKSLNVTMRKTLGLFANVRPVTSYHPFVPSVHPKLDVVIVRENEEDLYAGIEHRHTSEVLQCLKIISIPGCERIIRYAFDYCRSHGRKKLTCVTKSNIMKLTDGAFQRVFTDMAKQYPDIKTDHQIVDIATARLAARPQDYDVVVTLNLYGDIISDVVAEIAGSVGLCGSSNIGTKVAMFEAIHGSAPDIAGQDVANPGGLINASIMMLNYLGRHDKASLIHNAFLRTIEDGVHTTDIHCALTTTKVGTRGFTDAIIERLGQAPLRLPVIDYANPAHGGKGKKDIPPPTFDIPEKPRRTVPKKDLVGVDIFVDWDPSDGDRDPNVLAEYLQKDVGDKFKLQMISNRGVLVWPDGHPETYKVDHWRCRFVLNELGGNVDQIIPLMQQLADNGLEVIKTENLYNFNGEAGYSRGQGQ